MKIPGSHGLKVRLSKLLDKEVWMVTDREGRRLMELLGKGMSLASVAAIDRLVHHSIILELNLPSYRLEHSTAHKEARTEV